MNIPSNWFEDFFYGLALDLWRKAVPLEHTKAEADFIAEALQCHAGAHLLDVPCGNGRLSFELAGRGYRVTGIDISKEFIDEAQQRIPTHSGSVEFHLGDMRKIEGDSTYDGAYCFGNSFGYLEYADMEKFVGGVARALKPGARFIVETGMTAESTIGKFEEETSHQIADIHATIKERYLADQSCIDSEYIFEREGVSQSYFAKHWIYTAAEIGRMLERAGFSIEGMYGSLKREPFVLGLDELFVVGKKS
jgi:cyclopropane fatty-acyl-phospholipid synthase-like methyltransferase